MNKTDSLNIRIEPGLKKNVEKTLKALGMTTTEAINLYLHQIILSGGIPFEVKLPKPNKKTLDAMKEAMIVHEKNEGYNSVEELFDNLDNEIDNEK